MRADAGRGGQGTGPQTEAVARSGAGGRRAGPALPVRQPRQLPGRSRLVPDRQRGRRNPEFRWACRCLDRGSRVLAVRLDGLHRAPDPRRHHLGGAVRHGQRRRRPGRPGAGPAPRWHRRRPGRRHRPHAALVRRVGRPAHHVVGRGAGRAGRSFRDRGVRAGGRPPAPARAHPRVDHAGDRPLVVRGDGVDRGEDPRVVRARQGRP